VSFFYAGLIISAIGTGLLKPNVSVMVGQLYGAEDSRRDAGFSIFYMGINLGAFLAPLICGYAGQRVNWHLGFAVAAVGMVLGLIQYVLGGRHLGEAGLRPSTPPGELQAETQRRLLRRGLWAGAGLVAALLLLDTTGLVDVTVTRLSDALGVVLLGAVGAFFVWAYAGRSWSPGEKKRLGAVGVLFAGSALFWCMFEQAGSTLNLFAERSTDKRLFGFELPASWFQSLNALFIIALAPVFAWLWVRLGRREPSSPAKFAFGLLSAALGFAVLAVGAGRAEAGAQVSPLWLVAVYLLHTIGELFLSPVGLSAMTKLAPERITSLLMGVWFVSLSAGNYLGGRIASMYESLPLPTLFALIAAFGAGAALALAVLIQPTKRLMGGVR
jgi:POT family proton-dependent oligopeptide transporter